MIVTNSFGIEMISSMYNWEKTDFCIRCGKEEN